MDYNDGLSCARPQAWNEGNAMVRTHRCLPLLAAVLLMISCDSGTTPSPGPTAGNPPKQAPPAEKNSAETGRFAFQKVFIAARGWAPDAKPVSLESQLTKAFNGQEGKAGVWRAAFASPSKQAMKAWTWSGVTAD